MSACNYYPRETGNNVTRGKKTALVESADAEVDVNGVPLTSGLCASFPSPVLFSFSSFSFHCFLLYFPSHLLNYRESNFARYRESATATLWESTEYKYIGASATFNAKIGTVQMEPYTLHLYLLTLFVHVSRNSF